MDPRRLSLRLEPLEPRELLSISAFPDTSTGIHLLSDQLAGGNSDALVRFIASHYDGTQKMLPGENARYVADNPNWVLLHYRLATASGPASYITGGQWGSDWASVTAHEDWFLHDPSGQRLHNSTWNWDLHDVMNPDWRQYWLSSVIADMRTEGAQGVFADSFDAGIGDGWFDQTDPRFTGTNAANPDAWPGGFTWLDQLQDLINYMEAGLAATPEQFVYVPNLDALVTGWNTMDYSRLDGGFLEGFGDWGPAYLHGSSSDWTLSMNRALAMSGAGKILIMQPSLLDTPDSATGLLQRGFDLGTYLLLKGSHTYLNLLAGGSDSGAYYYPEDALDLGPAVTPLASDVSQYLWNNVYRRDFQNGIVLVNPTDTTYTVPLGQTYQEVQYSGGGALTDASLDASGNYIGGSLSTTPVDTVTLAPGSAVILLNGTTGAASQLTVSAPAGATAGAPFSVTVTARDASGNVVTGYTGTVTFASSDPGASLPADYTFTAADAGTHTFTVTLTTAGNQSVTATDTATASITGSAAVTVSPAAADHLVFLQPPTDTAAGQTISPAVAVAVVDPYGNVVTGDNSDTVTLAIGTNPGGGSLGGTLSVAVVNGVATFGDLSIDQAGSGYTLHATVGGSLPDIDSDPFNIT